jgi:serine/threonine-protein kinase
MKECPKCELCFSDEVNFCPHDQSPTRFSLPGTQLLAERYFLERKIGRGAMGQVYLAKDKKFDTRRVAVKTVRQDLLSSDDLQEGEALVRFELEAQAAAAIQHPNTVSVTDFGESKEGVVYLVMEYVEGETLHKLLRREGTLTVKRAVRLLRQIADGVEAAHEVGILHRDLKPANIFIMQKGKSVDGFVKVGDFGLAKIVNRTSTGIDSVGAPVSRGIVGTPEFMAPEQMQPELGVDVRADVYALGTIAYLMLGGKTPFSGDLMQLVMQKIMHKPAPLSTLRSDIPIEVERAVMRALEIDPNDRPGSISDWMAEMAIAADESNENIQSGKSRLIVLAPDGAEVYVNDERKGSIGSSGRLVLASVPAGRHILRVAKAGEKDDERVIEITGEASEQVIQAQLKPAFGTSSSQPSRSQGSASTPQSLLPGIVVCTNCQSRFAEGVKFCGRCGNRSFVLISRNEAAGNWFSCPRCATRLSAQSKFCGRCGLKVGQTTNSPPRPPASFSAASPIQTQQSNKTCGKCGGVFSANTKFCGRCGNSL